MSPEPARVGIVMLMYNRADVVVACLRSLARAGTHAAWELYLLDNASRPEESTAARDEFDRLAAAGHLVGQFVRSEVNHGFPKGNNLGIRAFLERDDITHLCLLNSDVIVTDLWLDRLLEKGVDAIGPVTNACGNEQTIPVPRTFQPHDDVFPVANEWAQARYTTFYSCCPETDFLGFFCFLARLELFLAVGFLDERFGRGAYEDDDYCLRILAKGFRMHVARDVFIYHFGTASFSQIPLRTLQGFLAKNRKKFEDKYGIAWKDRSLLPLLGVWQDVEHLARKAGKEDHALVQFSGQRSMDTVRQLIHQEGLNQPLGGAWRRWRASRERLAAWWTRKAPARVVEFLRTFATARPVIVLGRWYPADADLKDGYFQRVKLIDDVLADHCRVYLRTQDVQVSGRLLPYIAKRGHRVYEIGIQRPKLTHCAFAAALAWWSGRIYVHSVLRFADPLTIHLYRLARIRVFDVHGVVPEEFAYEGDEGHARRFGDLERLAVERASLLVVVTHAMADHLAAKYSAGTVPPYACLSMLPPGGRWARDAEDGTRDGVLYSGGLHKWQQVDKMLDYVHATHGATRVTFLVTDPDEIRRRYRARHGGEFPGVVDSVPQAEIGDWCRRHAFGLVLREAIVVNAVACPTKLVEYLQHGLVPVVDSARIGDFERFGYRYVMVTQPLPDAAARAVMARANRSVLRKLRYQFLCDREKVEGVLSDSRGTSGRSAAQR